MIVGSLCIWFECPGGMAVWYLESWERIHALMLILGNDLDRSCEI